MSLPETHSAMKLAAALKLADLPDMAEKAATGYYHDFLSPLAMPCLRLDMDLADIGTPAAAAIRARHHCGDFDATIEESEEWARSPDGTSALRDMFHSIGKTEAGR